MTNTTLAPAQYLRVDEVADTLRMSKMTVYRLIHVGTIPSIRVGRTFRIPAGAFAEYLSGLERHQQPAPVTPGQLLVGQVADQLTEIARRTPTA